MSRLRVLCPQTCFNLCSGREKELRCSETPNNTGRFNNIIRQSVLESEASKNKEKRCRMEHTQMSTGRNGMGGGDRERRREEDRQESKREGERA